MINKHYSFSRIFHQEMTLSERVTIFNKYARSYQVRLYRLAEGFAFPDMICKDHYSPEDFEEADGVVVGEPLQKQPQQVGELTASHSH
jgi:hypothetical protein